MARSSGKERREKIRDTVQDSLRPLTVPNFITLIRLAMVPFFLLAISERDYALALVIFVLAGITDAADGLVARFLHMESRFGAYLDPMADKLLLVTAYVSLTIPHGQEVVIPLWLTLVALSRDVLIVVVALLLYLAEEVRQFTPSVLGKLTTAMHVVTVAVVLLANTVALPGWAPAACFTVTFVLVIASGMHYIYREARHQHQDRERPEQAE